MIRIISDLPFERPILRKRPRHLTVTLSIHPQEYPWQLLKHYKNIFLKKEKKQQHISAVKDGDYCSLPVGVTLQTELKIVV